MRRLAADLGVEVMSLYHHLPNKSALLDGLVDAIVEELDEATREGTAADWRDSRAEFEFTLDLLLDGLERRRSAAPSR